MMNRFPFQTRRLLSSILFSLIVPIALQAADWPTYQHDNARSGVVDDRLPTPLAETWVYRPDFRPDQAWPGPAKWDGWNKVYNLKDRMIFDKAFQVASVGDRLYFGSSVDDKIYCLDARTGETVWTFFTEGPVRLAPSVTDGKLYVGSDDGHVYCLRADDGRLVWKQRVGPADRRVPGNGRVISLWAIRSGVVRVDDTVYACAGIFPSETVYLAAMDAETGKPLWKTGMTDFPAQGYMLASSTRLFVTTGRSQPLVFDRVTGKRLYQATGGSTGGTYALIADDTLMYGPGKTGRLGVVGANEHTKLASFEGNHMIITGGISYLHTDTSLSALDRSTYVQLYRQRQELYIQAKAIRKKLGKVKPDEAKTMKEELARLSVEIDKFTQPLRDCIKWKAPCSYPLALILVGETLFAGGAGEFAAFDPADGRQLWRASVDGNVYGLAAANGRLFVSTDAGTIHCFTPSATETIATRPTGPTASGHPKNRVRPNPAFPDAVAAPRPASEKPLDVVHGPFIEFIDQGTIEVSWETDQPATSRVLFGVRNHKPRQIDNPELTRRHRLVISAVPRDVIHTVSIAGTTAAGRAIRTADYSFDSTFEYLPTRTPERPSPLPQDELTSRYRQIARAMLAEVGVGRGYALILGAGDGRLAYQLASQSDLQIIIVEPDPGRAEKIRRLFDDLAMYGARISVVQSEYDRLPFGPYFANLITADDTLLSGKLAGRIDEIERVLRPAGGVVYLGQWNSGGTTSLSHADVKSWRGAAKLRDGESRFQDDEGLFWIHRRGKLAGAGDWTHQYASPDNSSCSQDDLIRGDLSVLWWGRPGPRPMPDRGPRNPAPVSANGRLYVQGDRTLFGLDQYNGTILWAKQIPTMRRANIPRDGSNMVASDDYLYVAMRDVCVGFAGSSGRRELNFHVDSAEGEPLNWGYLACVGENLIGSAVKRGSQYVGNDGEWFEHYKPNEIDRVTSRRLFVLDRHSGEEKWHYDRGVVMNSTITISDGLIHFVESRDPEALANSSGRLFAAVQRDQHLVTLELATGKVRWEKPYDFSKCQFMTYMSAGENKLVVMGSDEEKTFHTYAFDARTGYEIWQNHAPAQKKHHSGHLHHPTIIGDKMFVNKHTYELSTGNVLKIDEFDWHGCGVMSASKHSIFHRFEFHGMLDLHTNKRTEFQGIRSGCWLSIIPSGGVLLAPETSAGCSCSHAIQTSIAYVPKKRVDVEKVKQ